MANLHQNQPASPEYPTSKGPVENNICHPPTRSNRGTFPPREQLFHVWRKAATGVSFEQKH